MNALIRSINEDYEKTEKLKLADLERRKLDMHLRASQRIAHIGSWEADLTKDDPLDGAHSYWSDETYRILGYEKGRTKISGPLLFARLHPDDAGPVKQAFGKAVKAREIFDMEYRLSLPDTNQEKIVHSRARIISGESGAPLKMIGVIQDITSLRKAYKELQRTSEHTRLMIENMQETFFSIDRENGRQLLQMTSACEKVYGYSSEAFFEKPDLWFDLILEEDRPIIYQNTPVLESGQAVIQQYRIRHANGSIRWVESRLQPTMNAEGRISRIDGVTLDITERKEAEKALQDSEYLFRSLIENSADAIMLLDENGITLFASNSLYRIMGYSPEEVLGVPAVNFIHPEDQEKLSAHARNVFSHPEEPIALTYRRRKKDGTYIWCEGTATNFLHSPVVKGVVINFRNITERVLAEKALKDSEYKFRSLIENSHDMIVVADENLNRIFVSDSAMRLYGLPPSEMVFTSSFSQVHPDNRDEMERFFQEVLLTPGIRKTLISRERKTDGSYFWCERISINLLEDTAIKGIVSNLRDITKQKEDEETLRSINEELRHANREMDRFVYSVSHDLRAPLSSVLGLIELTQGDTSDEQTLQSLDLMKSSVKKLDGFIQDILDYSKNARTEVQSEVIDLKSLLDEVSDGLQYMNREKHVAIIKNVTGSNSFVSDRKRLIIILNNLVSNAIRYYDPKAPEPYVSIDIHVESGQAQIKVKDNGTGIAQEYQSRIFDMFFRASKSASGSGLGLYILKEAVEKLNGTIKLWSMPGEGSEFSLTIPEFKNL